jgi:hypothetical protein
MLQIVTCLRGHLFNRCQHKSLLHLINRGEVLAAIDRFAVSDQRLFYGKNWPGAVRQVTE